MSEPPFSLNEDDAMLEIVANTPAIYNQLHRDYKDHILKEKEWAKVSEKVGRSVQSCKKRWRTIRDNYYKQEKHSKRNGSPFGRKYALAKKLKFLEYKKQPNLFAVGVIQDGSEGSDNFEDLDEASSNFVEVIEEIKDEVHQNDGSEYKTIEPSNSFSFKILGSEESFDPSNSQSANKTNPSPQVTKVIEKKNDMAIMMKQLVELSKPKELDDVDLFFRSMAMSVKKFSQENIARAKLKICQVVMEMELEKS